MRDLHRAGERTGVQAMLSANWAQYNLSAVSASLLVGDPTIAASNTLTRRCEAAPMPR